MSFLFNLMCPGLLCCPFACQPSDFCVRVCAVSNLHCVAGTSAPVSDREVMQLCCLSIPRCSMPEAFQSHEPYLQECCLQMTVHRYQGSWAQVEAGVLGFLVPPQFPEAVCFHAQTFTTTTAASGRPGCCVWLEWEQDMHSPLCMALPSITFQRE